ncbi:MAG: dihydropteroate synthase [Leptospiraceae bacterium]|nr:dihydropteroate synthase [Leptospiraceae bacterium]MDW7976832.1 dihydropteroate synthase [Leptospiraceae bacterium]
MWNWNIKIAGILNITEDSFSDGGEYLSLEKAEEKMWDLLQQGADVVDVGAVSSNPKGKDVPIEEEIRRLQPILEIAKKNQIPISVDTWRFETQRFCLEYHVDFINDITGFSHPEIFSLLKDTETKCIVMHQVSNNPGKADPTYEIEFDKLWQQMIQFFDKKIEQFLSHGISEDRILLDPGMGFFLGKDYLHSFRMINLLPELKKRYKKAIYVSVSRKSFLGVAAGIENPKDRDYATLACEIALLSKNIDWIRTHQPKALRDAIKVLKHIQI